MMGKLPVDSSSSDGETPAAGSSADKSLAEAADHRRGEPSPSPRPPEEAPRLPLAMRLLLFYSFILVLLNFGSAVLLSLFIPLEDLATGIDIDYSVLLAVQAAMAIPVMLGVRAFVKRFEGAPLAYIGVRLPGEPGQVWRWAALAAGGAVGALGLWWLLAGFLLDLEVQGWLPDTVDGASWWPGAAGRALSVMTLALAFLAIATIEEWIYRGYIYSLLRQRFAWVHAAGITTMLYLLLLAGGMSIPPAGLFNILLLELLLAGLREASGSVWTGVIFHATWNVFLGGVISLPVSGQSMPRFWQVTTDGHPLLSGGDFGPEGSVILTVLLLAALAFVASRLRPADTVPPPEV